MLVWGSVSNQTRPLYYLLGARVVGVAGVVGVVAGSQLVGVGSYGWRGVWLEGGLGANKKTPGFKQMFRTS